MGAKRTYWTWGLLAVALVGLATSFFGNWYEMSAAAPRFGFDQDPGDIEPAPWLFHTDLWRPMHLMEAGGFGEPSGYESVPRIAQVLEVMRPFYLLGVLGAIVATVGLLFRVRGIVDGKGIIASIAILSVLFMGFGVTYFAANVADAYNDELDDSMDGSPELAFFTFGGESEEGTWTNVTSGPRLGWFGGVVGTLAFAGAFGFVYATDLRRARDILTDDEAAVEAYERQTTERRHVLERIREGGRE